MRLAVEFGIWAGEEQDARAALRRKQQDVAPHRPGDVVAFERAEERVLAVFAGARRIDRDPAQARREKLRPAVITAQFAGSFAGQRRLERLPEDKTCRD